MTDNQVCTLVASCRTLIRDIPLTQEIYNFVLVGIFEVFDLQEGSCSNFLRLKDMLRIIYIHNRWSQKVVKCKVDQLKLDKVKNQIGLDFIRLP